METIYFQPKGIRPQYCEAGMIHESDPEHIWCLDEPCKILISEVKIIPKENVTYDKKSRNTIVSTLFLERCRFMKLYKWEGTGVYLCATIIDCTSDAKEMI